MIKPEYSGFIPQREGGTENRLLRLRSEIQNGISEPLIRLHIGRRREFDPCNGRHYRFTELCITSGRSCHEHQTIRREK